MQRKNIMQNLFRVLFMGISLVVLKTNLYGLDLNNPYGIATNGNYLYIADTGNCRIVRCNLDGSNPLVYGDVGKGEGKFMQPQGIGVTPQGDIYVVDTGNHRIQKLKDNGTTISFVKTIGQEGEGIVQFLLPRDIAIDFRNGYFLVCDSFNQRISKFSLDGNPINSFSGSNSFGQWGTQTGKLWHPYGIDIDNQGNIYVADTYNHRIQKFSSQGSYILSFGKMGQGEGEFLMPCDVVVDNDGYISVIDTENQRVQKFSSSGGYIEFYGKPGQGKGKLMHPQKGIIAKDGNLYVVDSTGNKFEAFNIGTYITFVSCLPSIFSPNNDGAFDNATISYTIPEQARITINIYDSNGALVRNLIDAERASGQQSEVWNGKDNSSVILSDGKYTYVINALNSLNYRPPQKKGEVNIDNTPPAITNLEALPNIVAPGKQVNLRACITDNLSGIAS
ncbi:MAG: 6-bladed beta-propeller, partial [bacterium]